jgi:hypothetical protein
MRKEVKEILENFDFIKVNEVMKFLNWTWFGGEVPNIAKLIMRASELLEDVYNACEQNKDEYTISTGGFEAEAFYEDGIINLRLKFVLTDWDNF